MAKEYVKCTDCKKTLRFYNEYKKVIQDNQGHLEEVEDYEDGYKKAICPNCGGFNTHIIVK